MTFQEQLKSVQQEYAVTKTEVLMKKIINLTQLVRFENDKKNTSKSKDVEVYDKLIAYYTQELAAL